MKRITYLAFGLTCLLGLVPLAQAQYTGVLQVRYQSTAYPESFDQFVANNQSLFDNRFFSCLNSLEGVWRPLANQEAATCEIHLNPQWKQKCLSEAKFLSLYTWSKSVRVVLAGTSRWVDTPAGKAAITGKSFTEAMMPGIFVLGIEQSIPAQSPDLVCR